MRALWLGSLLMAATFAAAQEFPIQGPATNDPTANSSQLRTYQGCVVRSRDGIELDGISHSRFRLMSDRPLDSYVGKEVSIDAHDVNPNDSSSDERGVGVVRTTRKAVTLEVEDIQKMAETCTPRK